MTIAVEQGAERRRLTPDVAANDDHVGRVAGPAAASRAQNPTETTGWNAYEVWRRLIKEARDRRALMNFPMP